MATKLTFSNFVAIGSISPQPLTLVAGQYHYPTQTLSSSISDDGSMPTGAGIFRVLVDSDICARSAPNSSSSTPSVQRGYCSGVTFDSTAIPLFVPNGSSVDSHATFADFDPVTGLLWTRTSLFAHTYGLTIPYADNVALAGYNGTDDSAPVDWDSFNLSVYYFYVAHLDVVTGPAAGGTTVVVGVNGIFDSASTVSSVTFGGVAASIVSVAPGKTYDAEVTVTTPAGTGVVDVVVTSNSTHSAFATKAAAFSYVGGSAPSNLVATPYSVNPARIDLTWNDNSTGEAGFEVYRAQEPYPTVFSFADTAFTTSYADTTVGVGTVYYYKVRAVGGGAGFPTGYSNTATAALATSYRYGTYVGGVGTALTSTTGFPPFGCAVGGTAMTLVGTGFVGSSVTFGGSAATSVVVVNSTTITCVTPAHAAGLVDIVITNSDTTVSRIPNGFRYATPWWRQTQTLTILLDGQELTFTFERFVQQCEPPSDGTWGIYDFSAPVLMWWTLADLGWYVYQVAQPEDEWELSAPPNNGVTVDNNGWYFSTASFGGSVVTVTNSAPADCRTWADIGVWAAGATGMLGGSPAASCVFKNRMIYPSTGYVVGTGYPPIHVFNGSFDHELAQLPPTTTNTIPKAVMSMLSANGTIYLTSFDSGTSSADWAGRVFELNLESGALTPIGAGFSGGEMPYALAWHMGRLWVGTNNGIGTVGKVYYFRPGVDTSWTQDYDLATSSVGGVDSLHSFNGKLYVGSDNAAAAFAKVLVRDSAGAYTTSLTATGGTARVNNGFLSMVEFESNLYAGYWNNDTTAVAKVYKFDGSSWTAAYTGATTTLRPFILLVVDDGYLFAFGGGKLLAGAILRTPDGTTWTNLSAQLPEADKTLLPLYGVEIL